MKHISYSYKVIVNFTITKEELEHLIFLSTKHYDGKCQDASKQGGFIYGWKNYLEFSNQREVEIDATIKEIDTVTKILEIDCNDSIYCLRTAFNKLAQDACNESIKKNQPEL